MIKTRQDALAYLERALKWADVDMNNIDGHAIPGYLDAYDEIEPVTQEEANVVMELVIAAIEGQKK